jgi:glutamate 5-kinase
MVAGLTDADLLVLLSDIDGLYSKDPRENAGAELIPVVEDITPEIEALAGGAGSKLGSGGMKTKISAARIAVSQGIPMVLANGGRRECLAFLNGDENGYGPEQQQVQGQGRQVFGTLFLPKPNSLGSRKGWLAFSTRPAASVIVDDGASVAILEKGKSLLPSGILQVEGNFQRGEVVDIMHDSETIARGIVNFSSGDIQLIRGRHSSEIESILGPGYDQEVIHRDNLSQLKGK